MKHKKLINKFEKAYRTQEVKNLLTPRWKKENEVKDAPPSTGHCYIAAEAAFHILKKQKPKGFCASYVDENNMHATHWWVVLQDGLIVDPTASQYIGVGENPPYHLGKAKGFLTKKPSKRAKILMKIVMSL